MTQDEIIEMLKEADLDFLLGDNWMLHHELLAFARLVAAKEREALAQTQEPVAIVDANDDGYWADILPNISVKVGQMLYTNPPQRSEPSGKPSAWVGLTRMDLIKCGVLPFGMSYELCQAIEAKLKEKNT